MNTTNPEEIQTLIDDANKATKQVAVLCKMLSDSIRDLMNLKQVVQKFPQKNVNLHPVRQLIAAVLSPGIQQLSSTVRDIHLCNVPECDRKVTQFCTGCGKGYCDLHQPEEPLLTCTNCHQKVCSVCAVGVGKRNYICPDCYSSRYGESG